MNFDIETLEHLSYEEMEALSDELAFKSLDTFDARYRALFQELQPYRRARWLIQMNKRYTTVSFQVVVAVVRRQILNEEKQARIAKERMLTNQYKGHVNV